LCFLGDFAGGKPDRSSNFGSSLGDICLFRRICSHRFRNYGVYLRFRCRFTRFLLFLRVFDCNSGGFSSSLRLRRNSPGIRLTHLYRSSQVRSFRRFSA
jgi:hypothetical protein